MKIILLKMILIIFICISTSACKNNASNSATLNADNVELVAGEKLSIVEKIKENDALTIEERIALYRKLKKEDPEGYNFENEDELTMYGYLFLWSNKVKEAIEIFKLIVAEFPESSNAYDSLGEAYLQSGDSTLSLINYERSLAMNPDNYNAEDFIERIKFPERKIETPAEKFDKVYSVEEYRADLDQLGVDLMEIHPQVFKFISKEDFLKNIERNKALINEETTYAEFLWYCDEIIASVNCSHTSISDFYEQSGMMPVSLRFPLQTRWINKQLFVVEPGVNKNKVAIKEEIESINGVAVSTLIEDIYKHIPSQGYVETTKKHSFNTWSTFLIPYALGFPESYEIKIKGKETPIALLKEVKAKNMYDDPSIKKCDEGLCLEFLENNTAVLTISTFNYYRWNNYEVFENFIDKSFAEINKKKIKNLIIDLRFNGGGSPSAGIYLLRQLVSAPFIYYSNTDYDGKVGKSEGEEMLYPVENPYKGKVYFMIDGEGKSTTGHVMSIVKVLNLGTIVGEELGSNQFCSAGSKMGRLSNTKIIYSIANNSNKSMAIELPDEIGILPDYYVTQSIDDYLNRIDTVREFTLALIKKDSGLSLVIKGHPASLLMGG